MKKILNTTIWIIFLVPVIYLVAIWQNLPAKIPMRYNLSGSIERYGNKNELLLMLLIITAVNIGAYLFLINVHRFDPKKNGEENKDRMQRMAFVISVFISGLLCAIIYSSIRESIEFIPGIIFSGVGLLFSFMGNYMYNMKPNYFAGLRLRWTLENEDNWRKTHHLAGKLWFIGGLAIAIICLPLSFKAGIIIFFIVIAILVTIPFYTLIVFINNKKTSIELFSPRISFLQ